MTSLRERFEAAGIKANDVGEVINQALLKRAEGLKDEIIAKIEAKEKEAAGGITRRERLIDPPARMKEVVEILSVKDDEIKIYLPVQPKEAETIKGLEGYRKLHEVCSDPAVDMRVEIIDRSHEKPSQEVRFHIAVRLNEPYRFSVDPPVMKKANDGAPKGLKPPGFGAG